MQRIPPSEQIRKQLDDLLDHGLVGQENLIGTLVQLGARLVVQELLERETTEQLGRAHYQHRRPGEPLRGYRNGYEPSHLRTAEGDMPVQVPQVRDWIGEEPYRSDLMAFLRGNSDVLKRLATEMYARGLSVRNIEDALCDATGKPLLSRTAVSELTETLWEDMKPSASETCPLLQWSTCSSMPCTRACANGAVARVCCVLGASARTGAR